MKLSCETSKYFLNLLKFFLLFPTFFTKPSCLYHPVVKPFAMHKADRKSDRADRPVREHPDPDSHRTKAQIPAQKHTEADP